MYKCKQACVFQSEDKTLHTFEAGKNYSKEEVAVVPKDAFKGEAPFFRELEDAEVEETTATAKPAKKAKEETVVKDDPRV